MGVKKVISFVLMIVMVSSMLTLTAFADGEKYTTETTKEGWIKVINEDGATLGYSPDSGVTIIEEDGYAFKDSNRNGALDPYEDWRLDADTRAEDLAAQISIEMIPALMLLSTEGPWGGELSDACKAALDAGCRTFDGSATDIENAVELSNIIQAYAEALDFAIPVEFHAETGSSMSVSISTNWPEPLAMGASFKPEIAQAAGASKSAEYRVVGITTVNSPQIDLATEPRWSRIAGTFTEDPQLAMDMAKAYANGLQSTFDEDGNDLGWGMGSVNATLKHFPGNGTAEAGREAHNAYGKYNVYPGDNFYTQLLPFKAAMELDGLTGSAAGVMPDYGIGLDENGDPIGDDRVASGFNYYTITEILRDYLEFDGVVVTDYDIVQMRGWGLEEASEPERAMYIIKAGVDKVGHYGNPDNVLLDVYKTYEEEVGTEEAEARYRDSARRIVRNMIHLGLLDNPYLEVKTAKDVIGDKDREEAAEEAMKECMVMVKNSNGLICERSEKPTVYIPLEYDPGTPGTEGNESSAGSAATPASANLPVDIRTLSAYFNVVTDTTASPYTGPEDEDGNPTMVEEDIIRASAEEIAACDFTLVFISSPSHNSGFDSATSTYIPVSLQYRPYTADSFYVRQQSIGGDLQTVEVQDTYGAQMITTPENRSYYGKTGTVSNEADLDKVLYAASVSDNVVVMISASGPMIFSEFEPEVEAILINFGGISEDAQLAVIGGQFEPQGLLPLQMPANMETVEMQYEDVPRDMDCHIDSDGNTYDFAFGLNWSGVIDDERVEKYSADPIEE